MEYSVCGNRVGSYIDNVYRCQTENCQKDIKREDVEKDAFACMRTYGLEDFEQAVKRLKEKQESLIVEILEKEVDLASENSKLKNLYNRTESNSVLDQTIKGWDQTPGVLALLHAFMQG